MASWRLYDHYLKNSYPPYAQIDIDKNELVKEIKSKRALFARWTSDFDCGNETEWWYCLRDKPIDLSEFKSKVRNEINRGLSTTDYSLLKKEDLNVYAPQMFEVFTACIAEYPPKYRPTRTYKAFRRKVAAVAGGGHYWLCKDRETGVLCGYAECLFIGDAVNMTVVKVHPKFLKNRVNAGLAYTLCHYYLNEQGKRFLYDGQRNIRHETNYQSFLCKQLGFRYAYCRLNVVYHPIMGFAVKFLYPFRKIIKKISNSNAFLYNLYIVLKQEEIVRSF